MIGRLLAASVMAFFAPTLAAASEPPPVALAPAPELWPTAPIDEPMLPPPNYPEPPPLIADRILRDGSIYDGFDTGELEYLKGFFPEALAEERAQYADLKAWYKQCAEEGRARLKAEMLEHGVTLIEGKFNGAAPVCQQVVFGNDELLERFESYEEFAKTARVARLVFDGLIQGLDIHTTSNAALLNRDILDEIDFFEWPYLALLKAQFWGKTTGFGGRITFDLDRPPKMTPNERFVFGAYIESELVRLQFARIRWLEEIVGVHGWPTDANSTRAGAGNALLMVWQGDHDPAFQLRMLPLIKASAEAGGIKGWEFAEVYDGVMLKLTGKQRYGTHFSCGEDKSPLFKLEDPDKLEFWRAQMGLEPIGDYLEYIRAECGD